MLRPLRQRLQKAVAGQAGRVIAALATGVLANCASFDPSAGMELAHAVPHPIMGPAYHVMSWDSHRHLTMRKASDGPSRFRYVDEARGTVTTLYGASIAMQFETKGLDGRSYRGTQFSSDNAEQLAFLDTWSAASFCDTARQSDEKGTLAPGDCRLVVMWLSLDGGATFHSRLVNLPARHTTYGSSDFAFLIIRGNAAYVGVRDAKTRECLLRCWYDGRDRVAHMDRPGGQALSRVYGHHDHAFVFSIELSQATDQQGAGTPEKGSDPRCRLEDAHRPADTKLKVLVARRLEGQALEELQIPPVEEAVLPRLQDRFHPPGDAAYQEEVRRRFVESLRSEHPEWAAAQTLDIGPVRHETSAERQRREAKDKASAARAGQCPDPFWYPGGGAEL